MHLSGSERRPCSGILNKLCRKGENGGPMARVKVNLVVLAVAALVATGCGATGGGGGTRLTLVAYSTPREAFATLIPAFQKTAAGKGVSFSQSYGASGDQSRAVAAGLPSDVVELSLTP